MRKKRATFDERVMAIVGDNRAKALMALRLLATCDWLGDDAQQAAREVPAELADEGFDFFIAASLMN